MALTSFLPLFLAVGVLLALGLVPFVSRSNRIVSRLARLWFGRFVTDSVERRRALQAAYSETTYRVYASKTMFYTLVFGGVFAVVGVYLIAGILLILPPIAALLAQLPSVMGEVLGNRNLEIVLSPVQRTMLYIVSGLALGGTAATVTYTMRWQLPKSTAEVRRRSINEALPRTVAFMYALSRGGTAFPTVMRTLGDNTDIYGEAAAEVEVGVREMELFNTDIITSVRRVSYRTPSEKWKTFTENLASVLQSGQSLPTFLQQQYDRYQEEAEERQEEILELLATIAEAYVTTLVAGSLFLITILLVFGLTTTDTLLFIQLFVYLVVPLANAGFVVFLMQKLEQLGVARESGVAQLESDSPSTTAPDTASADERMALSADGGTATAAAERNRSQLRLYDRIARIKRVLGQPLQTVLWHPTRILYVTIPLALLWVALRAPAAFASEGISIRIVDDILIQITLFVLGTFAVVRQFYKRRIDRIEAATPEMLERLASLNEAGMSVVESIDRIRDTDLGILTSEIERIWADVTMGANTDEALVRFGQRVRTTSIARVVTLITNAMRASGSLGPVLRIASEQARSDMRLRRQRRQQMFTYLVVIYISFVVFLVIIVAVKQVLVPSLPNTVPTPDSTNKLGVNVNQFARLGSVDKASYTLVFFHAALIQAICSGFIAGQLGDGTVKDGAKHAATMLGVAYILFILLSSPVASMTFQDQDTEGRAITVQSVSVSDGGYIVLREGEANGDILGNSSYLPPGTHSEVRIQLDRPPSREQVTVYAVPHLDENGNERFDGNATDGAYPKAGFQVAVPASITYLEEDGSDDTEASSSRSSGTAAVTPDPTNATTPTPTNTTTPGPGNGGGTPTPTPAVATPAARPVDAPPVG